MFANGGMYHTAVEQDLRGIGDGIKVPQCFLEFLIVIVSERLDPSLDFLSSVS